MDNRSRPPARRLDGMAATRPVAQPPAALSTETAPTSAWDAKSITDESVSKTDTIFEYQKPKIGMSRRKKLALATVGLAGLGGIFLGSKVILATRKIITRNAGSSAPALAGNVDPTKLKGEGDGRINILLMGIGGPGHEGPNLSDTIMVVSIDPRTKDVAMLSLPRDMYVPIPGYGSTKINAAHAYGEAYKYPGGGPALAKVTVSKLLDLPIHYFARVDFSGFKKAVDTVGGVDVAVAKDLHDPLFPCDNEKGGYCRFDVLAGLHHLDGTTALRYSRSRETTSDFDRAARQQQVMLALRQKALDLSTLSNPTKISGLIDVIGSHAKTDLQITEIRKLADIMKDIDPAKVISKVLDTAPDGLLVDANRGGAYVEVPKSGNYDQIREFVHGIFSDSYIKDEAATIEVQNGTHREGLAGIVSTMLKGYNYKVSGTATAANQNYVATILYDYSGGKAPYTISYLENRFHVKAQPAAPGPDDKQIKLILGADYRPTNSAGIDSGQ